MCKYNYYYPGKSLLKKIHTFVKQIVQDIKRKSLKKQQPRVQFNIKLTI